MSLTGKQPLIVILGPTAVGKTDLAIQLAHDLDGEIISADSRQIYRHMDIGTAKPTPAQRQQAVHHLIDVVNPDENLTLAEYQRLAYATINRLHTQGRVPLLVGGTGQYITAVIEGWSIPEVPPNAELRAELEAFAAHYGTEALHERLRQHDPAAASTIDHRNMRRVVRALEVTLESGRPISEQQRKSPPPYSIRQYGLTLDREQLYQRADERLNRMVEEGFVEEVQRLLDMGYDPALPAMSGLGYREIARHLVDNLPLAEAVIAAQRATHDFIRRQYTWFRGHDSGIIWYDVSRLQLDDLIKASRDWLQQG